MDKSFSWEKLGRICMYLIFGLVPVFFLPLTAFPVIENKQALTGLLVFIALGAWLAQTLNTGRVSIPKTRFWFVMLAFFAIMGVSTALSASRQTSMWGNLTSPDSLSNFLIYGLALFLVPLYFREVPHLIRALLFFSASLFVLSLYSLFQFFGVFLLPFDFTKQVSFNPIGTVQSLAILLGSGLVMIVALLTSFKLSQTLKAVFAFGAALLALILILVNFNYVWLGILLASALVVSWQVMHSRRAGMRGTEAEIPPATAGGVPHGTDAEMTQGGPSASSGQAMLAPKFGLPLVLMVIVAILFFVQPPISAIVQLPAEVRPSFSATADIAREGFSSNPLHIAFGSGPATFLYEYLIYRSTDLNATAFWGVRFTQGFATIPTFFVTLGLLGVASLLAMFGFFLVSGFRGVAALARGRSDMPDSKPTSTEATAGKPTERIALISFVSFIFLFTSWFYYPTNFAIFLFTFMFAGMVFAALRAGGSIESWNISLLSTPQRTFAASLIVIVLIVGVVVGVYWQGQKYVASVYHTFGVQAYNRDRDVDEALRKVSLAVNLDASRDIYWRTFTQLLSLRAQEVLNNTALDAAELQRRYQVVLQSMIQAGKQATQANPADPLNWRQLAAVYEDNITIVGGGADRFAIENYEKASSRNPKDPAEFLNVGRAYIRSADALTTQIVQLGRQDRVANAAEIERLQGEINEKLNKALEALQKSISLKGDYAPAHFLSSQVYERQGDRTLAIQKTVETRNLNPLDTGVGYQLGLLYYLDGQMENARDEFARVVNLNTDFSNARYFLGLIYDRLDNKEAAIDQFVRIEALNPDNQEVKRILENLRAGREALASIVPPAAPPETRIETPVPETGGARRESFVAPGAAAGQ